MKQDASGLRTVCHFGGNPQWDSAKQSSNSNLDVGAWEATNSRRRPVNNNKQPTTVVVQELSRKLSVPLLLPSRTRTHFGLSAKRSVKP